MIDCNVNIGMSTVLLQAKTGDRYQPKVDDAALTSYNCGESQCARTTSLFAG